MPHRYPVLIVEEDAENRKAIRQALRHQSVELGEIEAEVWEAETLAQARAAIAKQEFACIFLSHELPDGTGQTLLADLRADGAVTPVIILTGHRDEQVVLELMQAGAADYLPKNNLHPDLIARSLYAALRFLEAQREKQRVLNELHARDRALAAVSNGIVIADPHQPDCPIVYANPSFLQMTGYKEEEVTGRNCRFLQGPETQPGAIQEIRDALAQEQACQVKIRNYRKDGMAFWNEVTVAPVRDGRGRVTHFVGVQTDVTARQDAEIEREHLLDVTTRQAQELAQSEERLSLATRSASIGTWDYDPIADTLVWDDRCRAAFGLPPGIPVTYEGTFLAYMHPEDRERVDQVVQRSLDPLGDGFYSAEFRTIASDGVVRWAFATGQAYFDAARTHAERFIGIVIDVTERKRTEEDLAWALRREALLNRIGQAVRQDAAPVDVERAALAELAEALGADRCLSVLIDGPNERLQIAGEWRRANLKPLVGEYSFAQLGVNILALFEAQKTLIVPDVREHPLLAEASDSLMGMDIRSVINVPMTEQGELVGALGVYTADGPRAWTAEEAALVEAVASQMRAATEAARIRAKDHNIAEQLQAALQPPLPGALPGLAVAKHYEAALGDEAGVGGDFYDVFSAEKGCTALVVGDLSGKGLAAAAQVATVRNMLRAMIYASDTLVEAVTRLNDILAENDLLSGFATLFVGAYDSGAGTLNYVNCGQEPALLRRADSGKVSLLLPTGPILGSVPGVKFTEETAVLAPGDAVAIFSDGLTELGPNRREMLNLDGVQALFARPLHLPEPRSPQDAADSLLSFLMTAIDQYSAGSTLRDDQCLLVAVVGGKQ